MKLFLTTRSERLALALSKTQERILELETPTLKKLWDGLQRLWRGRLDRLFSEKPFEGLF